MKGPLYAMLVLGLVGYSLGGTDRECYSCTYSSVLQTDNSCEAPSASASKDTCNGQCLKYYSETSEGTSITRSCTPICIAIDCVESSGVKVCTTCCDSDLCNGAGFVTFNLAAVFCLITTAWGLSK